MKHILDLLVRLLVRKMPEDTHEVDCFVAPAEHGVGDGALGYYVNATAHGLFSPATHKTRYRVTLYLIDLNDTSRLTRYVVTLPPVEREELAQIEHAYPSMYFVDALLWLHYKLRRVYITDDGRVIDSIAESDRSIDMPCVLSHEQATRIAYYRERIKLRRTRDDADVEDYWW